MLTELALILCIDLAALVFAVAIARWTLGRASGSADLRRLASAASRASETFLWQENRVIAVAVATLAVALFAAHGYQTMQGEPPGTLHRATWTALAVAAGAASCCSVVYVTAQMTLRSAVRAVAATRAGVAQSLLVCLRAGGVAGLIADALSVFGTALLFGLLYLLAGGTAIRPELLAAVLRDAAVILPGFGFGAVVAAMVIGFGGGAYHVAANVAGAIAGERDRGLSHGDPRNPALVATFIGAHVGLTASRAADMFVASSIGNIVAWSIGVTIFTTAGDDKAWGLLTLPIVVRALGIVACAFGLMSARADEKGKLATALWRGQAVTGVVALGGLAAATRWLLGDAWLPLFAAGAIAVLTVAAAVHVGRLRLAHSSATRDLMEAARAGEAVSVARGLAQGFAGTWAPVLTLGVGLGAAWHVGALSKVAGGELLTLSTTLSTILAAGAYMLALDVVGPVASAATGVLEVDDAVGPEVQKDADRLEQAGLDATSVSQAYFIVVGCAGALLGAVLLPRLLGPLDPAKTLPAFDPVALWCGLLGAAAVLSFSGSALSQASKGARVAVLEVERQLRQFPREGGVAVIPEDYAPSYRTVVEQTARQASSRVGYAVFAALLAPAALGFALRLLYSSGALAIEGLASFVVIASATGLALALAADGARAALSAAYRASRPRGGPPGFEVSVTGNAVADLIGSSAAPAAHLVVKAVALTALVVAPLLSH